MRYAARRIRWDMRSMFHSDSDERLAVGLDVLHGSCGVSHRVCLQAESEGHQSTDATPVVDPTRRDAFQQDPGVVFTMMQGTDARQPKPGGGSTIPTRTGGWY